MNMTKTVCYCAHVTVQDIADAVVQGAKTIEEIQEITNAATCCGACDDHFENVAKELLEENQA